MKTLGIIPARFDSSRFPGKVLEKFLGTPILKHVYDNVNLSFTMNDVIVATDSSEIIYYCKNNKIPFFDMQEYEVCCGSERAWIVEKFYPKYNYYVTFPCDEPLINSLEINKMWNNFLQMDKNKNAVYTCYSPFYSHKRLLSNNSCKIARSGNRALYFSRNVIPGMKDLQELTCKKYSKHVGIFIFSKKVLKDNPKMWGGELSYLEGLEQISFLENGVPIYLIKIDHEYYGIDTLQDLQELEKKVIGR